MMQMKEAPGYACPEVDRRLKYLRWVDFEIKLVVSMCEQAYWLYVLFLFMLISC